MGHRLALDSVAVRDSRLFGWGWFLDDAAPADRIELAIRLVDGAKRLSRCPQAGSRPDLAEAFPLVAHAAGGGFMLQARLPNRADIERIELHVQLRNGEVLCLHLPQIEHACNSEDLDPGAIPCGVGKGRWRTAWELVRGSQWRALWQLMKDFVLRRLAPVHASVAPRPAPRDGRAAWVMFDHAMGGGTNRFREERIAEWCVAGIEVTLVTPVLATLEYEVSRFGEEGLLHSRRHPGLGDCLGSLGRFERIVVNNLASYDDPLQVLAWAGARRAQGAALRFYLHDFHAACPVWTLIDDEGKYCGLPRFERCATCLPANPGLFLAMMPSLDMPGWRHAWGGFLRAADEIVGFSASSIGILRQAYPELDPARIELRPHSTTYLGEPPPAFQPRLGEVATIGVVGAISEPKGARVIGEMVRLIESRCLPVRIVVIGSIDGVPPSPALRVTGPYQSGDLPDLLAREQVAIAFLPSVVHETFSYVTAELMHYRVPLAVFDLGAPAERVRGYDRGRIIPLVDAQAALDELLAFHRELSAATAGDPPTDAP